MRYGVFLLVAALAAGPLPAQQTETLADIRQDLSALYYEMQRLRTELSTTGGTDLIIGGGTLDRVNAIEAELQRLTSRTEEMQFRITRIVEDGTNRIGDLEFRLCELEPACDISTLGDTPRLGGGAAPTVGTGPAPVQNPVADTGGVELAAGEDADFRRAQEALASGDFQSAADQFATFRETYPGGPLEPAALVGQGKALEALGDTRSAARAYLDAYSGYPQAEAAPEALFLLGRALGQLGSVQEACVTLSEVAIRFPGSASVSDAQAARSSLGCS